MTLELMNETDASFDFDMEEIARLTVNGVLKHEAFPKEASVSITIVSEEDIQSINSEQREIDAVTDVLSFPMLPWSAPVNYAELDSFEDIYDPDTKEVFLGDVVLCEQRIKDQAKEYGHSEKREFSFLICHSMLHLLGYDHMVEEDRVLMEAHQEAIMNEINIVREAGE